MLAIGDERGRQPKIHSRYSVLKYRGILKKEPGSMTEYETLAELLGRSRYSSCWMMHLQVRGRTDLYLRDYGLSICKPNELSRKK